MYLIQSTSNPANDNLMELLLVIDALKRSSAKTITAVIHILVMRDKIGRLLPEPQFQLKLSLTY